MTLTIPGRSLPREGVYVMHLRMWKWDWQREPTEEGKRWIKEVADRPEQLQSFLPLPVGAREMMGVELYYPDPQDLESSRLRTS